MPATRDGKTWGSQFYYEDWQGVRHKKNKKEQERMEQQARQYNRSYGAR